MKKLLILFMGLIVLSLAGCDIDDKDEENSYTYSNYSGTYVVQDFIVNDSSGVPIENCSKTNGTNIKLIVAAGNANVSLNVNPLKCSNITAQTVIEKLDMFDDVFDKYKFTATNEMNFTIVGTMENDEDITYSITNNAFTIKETLTFNNNTYVVQIKATK